MSFRAGMIVVLGLAVVARGIVMAPAAARPPDDPDNYLPLARAMADGQGFVLNGRPTAYRPPLYPLLLASLMAPLGPRTPTALLLALNLALGVGTVGLTGWTARRWGFSASRSWLAATIVALDPVLVVQGRSVMTETLAAFLLAAVLAGLTRPGRLGPIAGGLGFGLASLCRPSTLAAALLTIVAAMIAPPGTPRARIERAALLFLTIVATLAPWAWRNARALGEPVWTTTHGGYTLALANNPVYYDEVLNGPPGAVWSGENQRRWWHANNLATGAMTEPQADRWLRDAALRVIAGRPRDFARASLARLGRFWGVAPSGAVYPIGVRVLVALWTIPFWITVVLGLFTSEFWRWPRIAAPALVLGLMLAHTVYWTDLRMRAPIVPALALVAVGTRVRVVAAERLGRKK